MMNYKAEFSSETADGLDGLRIVHLSGEPKAEWVNGIFQNSYAWTRLKISRAYNGWAVEHIVGDHRARKDGLKFRKMRAKTLEEARIKVDKWVEKNEKFFQKNT
jgi:hypothetical protein